MEKIQTIMPRGPLGLAREGYPILMVSTCLFLLGMIFFWPVGLAFLVFTAFSLYFFRDPEREGPEDSRGLLSPADGKVLKVESLEQSPVYEGAHQKISIFMSAFNVHVNRIPCDGVVTGVNYHPGQFFVASLDKASEHNERCSVLMETPQGKRVAFTQIAGLVARRIVCYLEKGLTVRRGERYGIIRFGSRMEVSVPKEWQVLVQPGDRVWAGKTVLVSQK